MEDRTQRDARRDAWFQAEGATMTCIATVDALGGVDAVADGPVQLAAMIEAGDPHRHASRGPPPPLRGGG